MSSPRRRTRGPLNRPRLTAWTNPTLTTLIRARPHSAALGKGEMARRPGGVGGQVRRAVDREPAAGASL
jgi:hypothetical protein